MAHKIHALSFLFVMVLISFVQIEARESKFFNKATVYSHDHKVKPPSPSPSPSPSSSPSPLPSPSEAPAPVESEYGYGLYGHGSTEVPDTKATTTSTTSDNNKSWIPDEFAEESDKEFNKNGFPSNYNEHAYVTKPQEPQDFSDTKFMETDKYFADPFSTPSTTKTNSIPFDENQNLNKDFNFDKENNGYTNPFNENSNVNEPQGLSDTRFMEKGKYFNDPVPFDEDEVPEQKSYEFNSNKENNGYSKRYNDNAYVTDQPHGLSDTRFMENGKYYNNPENEGNYGKFKESSGKNEGYYGNGEKSKYEFDSMEEYERQEGYPQTQEQYLP